MTRWVAGGDTGGRGVERWNGGGGVRGAAGAEDELVC